MVLKGEHDNISYDHYYAISQALDWDKENMIEGQWVSCFDGPVENIRLGKGNPILKVKLEYFISHSLVI